MRRPGPCDQAAGRGRRRRAPGGCRDPGGAAPRAHRRRAQPPAGGSRGRGVAPGARAAFAGNAVLRRHPHAERGGRMSPLLRALSAEALKLRGTLALWMCLIAPATVVALYVLQMTFMDYGKRPALPPADAWMMFAQSVLVLWALLMLPLFVTLESALLAGLEHANQQWKHLLALP